MSYSVVQKDSQSYGLLLCLLLVLIWLPLAYGSNQAMFWFYGQVGIQLVSVFAALQFATGRLVLTPAFARARWIILTLIAFAVLQLWIAFWPAANISIDLHATRQEFLKTICLIQVFCLILLLVDTQYKLKLTALALVYAGTFQAVYGTLMTVTGIERIWVVDKPVGIGFATGTFINRNHLAGYLEMTLALAIGLMIASLQPSGDVTWRGRLRALTNAMLGEKVRIRVCIVLMVIALILTRSRMGNTAFFVGLGIAGLIGLYTFRKSHSGIIWLFVSILVIDILLMGTFFGIDELQQRFQETDIRQDARSSLIALSGLLIAERPLLGFGGGTFYTAFPTVRDVGVSGFYFHADSDLVEFPVQYGLVGSGLLLAAFIQSLYSAVQVQLVRRNQFYRAMGFASTMALVSIAIHTTADFNLHVFANAVTFMCILAIPYVAMSLPSGNNQHS